jgi:hypothetical protein
MRGSIFGAACSGGAFYGTGVAVPSPGHQPSYSDIQRRIVLGY